MELTSHLQPGDRERVEARLRQNLMVWLTTVRPDGQPVSVPVWFLMREDGTILLYSQPGKQKLRNIADNPKVSLGLDVTDIGRNIVRMEGIARVAHDQPPANQQPAYLAKYTERIAALFDTPERFAELFSAAVIITSTKLHIRPRHDPRGADAPAPHSARCPADAGQSGAGGPAIRDGRPSNPGRRPAIRENSNLQQH
jgi:PPOX class probable F420-dependent enzyme